MSSSNDKRINTQAVTVAIDGPYYGLGAVNFEAIPTIRIRPPAVSIVRGHCRKKVTRKRVTRKTNLRNATILMANLLAFAACGDPSTTTNAGDGVDSGILPDAGSSADSGPMGENGRSCSGLTLPGNAFFPEGIAAGPSGTIAVTSAATGQVVEFVRGATSEPRELVAADEAAITNALGIRHDSTEGVYWVCSVDLAGLGTGMPRGTLVGVSDEDGSVVVSHALGATALCNDIAVSETHGVFATDSLGSSVFQVPRADVMTTDSAIIWANDARFSMDRAPDGLLLNGIAIDEIADALYTVRLDTGALFRVAMNGDGSAGTVDAINLTGGPLSSPDGLVVEASNQLLVIENLADGTVKRIVISGTDGTLTSVATGLEEPATGVIVGDDILVTNTQFATFFSGDPMPLLPFCVSRVPLGI